MQPNQQPPTSLSSSHVLDIEVFQASQPSQVPLVKVSMVRAASTPSVNSCFSPAQPQLF
jgi:hypothetical protein